MNVEEVVDRDTLRSYLSSLPPSEQRAVALRVAYKAALRALPISASSVLSDSWQRDQDLSPVAIFGSTAVAGVTAFFPRKFIDAAFAAGDVCAAVGRVAFTIMLDEVANAAAIADDAAFSAAASARSATVSRAASAANRATFAAAGIVTDMWEITRGDLIAEGPIWPSGIPQKMEALWAKAERRMHQHPADWSIWLHWYNRVLQGRDWHPQAMGAVLEKITREDWDKGPEHINPMFDEVLALYRSEDAKTSGSEPRDASANHVRTIRAQVSTLQEFLQAEYLNLAGHNARSPKQDEILELLKTLKALVSDMIDRLDGVEDSAGALVVVSETLPAVVEQTGELAVIEPEPVVSPTIATMSAAIKSLTDAGADPKLATQIAMSDVARQKLWPRIMGLFGRKP